MIYLSASPPHAYMFISSTSTFTPTPTPLPTNNSYDHGYRVDISFPSSMVSSSSLVAVFGLRSSSFPLPFCCLPVYPHHTPLVKFLGFGFTSPSSTATHLLLFLASKAIGAAMAIATRSRLTSSLVLEGTRKYIPGYAIGEYDSNGDEDSDSGRGEKSSFEDPR
ncbi:hypothetical protein D9758_011010 [Tetrapyrgos nigripes]|uniref:Uncharacterized protein n=1 Tax=Tetrapyrgos nigripes TaxID=182062 RepID=A0A8H5GHD7_9AGAR|nr:hypothetical protein D9758_011010 [Tetrapyrgos nigripes]